MRSVVLALLLCGCARPAPASPAASASVTWFQSTTQRLYDVIAIGDKGPWEKVLADDFISTSEDGVAQSRPELLASMGPLPPGLTGSIRVRDLTVRDLGGGGAVVHYWLDEWEDVFGQRLETGYVCTDTYRRASGDEAAATPWKMVATHTTVVPRDPVAVPVATPNEWQRIVGDYRVNATSDWRYHVFVRDGVLLGGSTEAKAVPLIPLGPFTFFPKGGIVTVLFRPDATGAIVEMRQLRKYNELVWTRVP